MSRLSTICLISFQNGAFERIKFKCNGLKDCLSPFSDVTLQIAASAKLEVEDAVIDYFFV